MHWLLESSGGRARPLAAALSHPSPRIRMSAAMAILKLDPQVPFAFHVDMGADGGSITDISVVASDPKAGDPALGPLMTTDGTLVVFSFDAATQTLTGSRADNGATVFTFVIDSSAASESDSEDPSASNAMLFACKASRRACA